MSKKRPRTSDFCENQYQKIYGPSHLRKKLKLLSQNSMSKPQSLGKQQKQAHCEQFLQEMPGFLQEMQVFALSPQNSLQNRVFLQQALGLESCVFRDIFPHIGLDNSLFSLKTLSTNYAAFPIELRSQKPEVSAGLLPAQTAKTATLGDYVAYQLSFGEAKETVDFAVNIDICSFSSQKLQLCCLPQELLWRSPCDCLRLLPQEISGVTAPQMYLKVKGCYTGGHEENLRVQTVNINHGPADSVWYLVEKAWVPGFRRSFLQEFGVDIYRSEGLWWASAEFCVRNGVKFKKFTQKAGDLVYLSAGTLHWVQGQGVAVHTSWNFLSASVENLQILCERLRINQELGVRSIIPARFLLLQLLSQEIGETVARFCGKIVEEFIAEDRKNAQGLRFDPQPEDSCVFFCDFCAQETFVYWALAEKGGFLCVNCARKASKKLEISYFSRFDEKLWLDNFRRKREKEYVIKKKLENAGGNLENSAAVHKKLVRSLYFCEEDYEIRENDAENRENHEKSQKLTISILSKLVSSAK